MRYFALTVWGVLTNPRPTFQSLADRPSFWAAVGVIVACSASDGLAVSFNEPNSMNAAALMAMLAVSLILFCSLLSGLTRLIGRLLRGSVGFKTIFCILVFANIPSFASSNVYYWSKHSWAAYHLWNAFSFAMLVWTSVLVWVGLRVAYRFGWWKTLLVTLPILGLLWSMQIWSWATSPPPLEAAERWQWVWTIEETTIFYAKDKGDIHRIKALQVCHQSLKKVCTTLQVEPPSFKVGVFLFPDAKRHERVLLKGNPGSGFYAHERGVSLLDGDAEQIRAPMTLALCHLVAQHRIAPNLHLCPLLNEGLAQCAADSDGKPPRVTTSVPLSSLTHSTTFYDPDTRAENEAVAHSFVHYLVKRYGLEEFKRLCREATHNQWTPIPTQLTSSVRKVYGVSLTELEREWRQKATPHILRIGSNDHR